MSKSAGFGEFGGVQLVDGEEPEAGNSGQWRENPRVGEAPAAVDGGLGIAAEADGDEPFIPAFALPQARADADDRI